MNYKYILLFMFIFYESVLTNPILQEIGSWLEQLEPEEKIREKRKVDLLQHLQNGGVGVKKVLSETEVQPETVKPEDLAAPEVPIEVKAEASSGEEEGTRAKKQAPDNVCIKEIGNGGKTSCGRIISARGPGTRMLLKNDPGMYPEAHGTDHAKMDKYASMQSRTFDSLFPVSPLTSSVTYAVPATTYAADTTATIGHTLPAIAAPAVPLAPLAHIEPVSLLSHSIPIHPMHTMFTHHPLMNLNVQRLEVPKLPEVIYTPAEIKQPAYEVKPVVATRPVSTPFVYPSRYGMVNSGFDSPMICHPYDEKLSQQVIQIRPEVHVIESGQKNLNSSVEEFKSQMGDDDEKKVHEHLRQVNEIREEINQLNRAAQKIVDQQERLAEMQQRHLWRSGDRTGNGWYTNPYNDVRMYMVPPSYSRSSALAYPTTADDMEFFMNMLKAGKKIGALSETFQPALTSASDAIRLVLSGEQGGQSGGGGGSQSGKVTKQEAARTDGKVTQN